MCPIYNELFVKPPYLGQPVELEFCDNCTKTIIRSNIYPYNLYIWSFDRNHEIANKKGAMTLITAPWDNTYLSLINHHVK